MVYDYLALYGIDAHFWIVVGLSVLKGIEQLQLADIKIGVCFWIGTLPLKMWTYF